MYDNRKSTSITETDFFYEVVQGAKLYYDIPPMAKISPFIFEDHFNYLIEDGKSATRRVLRITPSSYGKSDIISELAWTNEIRANTDILSPQPVRGLNGQFVQTVSIPSTLEQFNCVLFDFFYGPIMAECDKKQIPKKFKQLGEITAKLHQNSILYNGIKTSKNIVYDFENMIGENARFGLWHGASCLSGETDTLFTRTADVIKQRLNKYGMASSRFGLIHANMSLSNVMEVQNKFSVINFENCGLGWFLYDFSTAVNSIEYNENVCDLFNSWSKGYEKYRKLNWMETNEVLTFVMLSRLFTLCRKLNSADYRLHEELDPLYIQKTAEMADKYLTRFS